MTETEGQTALDFLKGTNRPASTKVPGRVVERVKSFGGQNPTFDRIPHTASAGPSSSQDAGDQHTDSGKRETNAMRVLKRVYWWPNWTATQHHGNQGKRPKLHLQEIRRRLTDLQALDYIEKGERQGREYTWNITTAGLLALSVADKTMGRP